MILSLSLLPAATFFCFYYFFFFFFIFCILISLLSRICVRTQIERNSWENQKFAIFPSRVYFSVFFSFERPFMDSIRTLPNNTNQHTAFACLWYSTQFERTSAISNYTFYFKFKWRRRRGENYTQKVLLSHFGTRKIFQRK